jgi:hypothetical protein
MRSIRQRGEDGNPESLPLRTNADNPEPAARTAAHRAKQQSWAGEFECSWEAKGGASVSVPLKAEVPSARSLKWTNASTLVDPTGAGSVAHRLVGQLGA